MKNNSPFWLFNYTERPPIRCCTKVPTPSQRIEAAIRVFKSPKKRRRRK